MHGILKHKLLIGVSAAALVALGGGAYAATQPDSSPRQAFLNDVAKRLNVSPSQLDSALKSAWIDRLNAAVKAGMLTQAQADQIEKRIQSGSGVPFFGPGLQGRRMFRGEGPFGGGGPIGGLAGYLGLSATQLMKDLSSGKSLAQIATAQGKSVSGLEQKMTAALKSRLDEAVADGRLTKSEEQQMLSDLSSKVGQIVNATPMHGLGDGGPPPFAIPGGPPKGGSGGASGTLGGPPPGVFGPAGIPQGAPPGV
jgi:hypothetical protein